MLKLSLIMLNKFAPDQKVPFFVHISPLLAYQGAVKSQFREAFWELITS